MLYVLTEDSKDGYKLISQLKEIYLGALQNQVTVESFHGIWDVDKKVAKKVSDAKDDDLFIIVLDYVIENPLIEPEIRKLYRYIKENSLKSRVKVLPIHSFELEILLMYDIELICNLNTYDIYFKELRDLYYDSDEKDIRLLTTKSKSEQKYDAWYAKARKDKRKKPRYKDLSEQDFERAMTIETISKRILSIVFQNNESFITKPMSGECWSDKGCSCSHFNCKYYFNTEIFKKDTQLKLKWIIQKTGYLNIIKKIQEMLNIQIYAEKDIDITETLDNLIYANWCNKIAKR